MLRIGEFSILSQISIHMLRHYDEIELLRPAQVDQFTGYRYYSEEQLPIANKIVSLKNMGLSLSTIKEMLSIYSNDEELKQYLKIQALSQNEKILEMKKQLNLIETTIESLSKSSNIPSYSVIPKKFEKHSVIYYRDRIPSYNCEGTLWQKLNESIEGCNIHYALPPYKIAIFHDDEYLMENVDVEVQKTVIDNDQKTGKYNIKTVEAFTAATLTYKGHYSMLTEVYEAIARWIADNHYKISGPRFNIYHISPETEISYDNMITEVCFPIKECGNSVLEG